MRFHVNARNVLGQYLLGLGSYGNREAAERAAKWMRKWLPDFFTIEVTEDHEVTNA